MICVCSILTDERPALSTSDITDELSVSSALPKKVYWWSLGLVCPALFLKTVKWRIFGHLKELRLLKSHSLESNLHYWLRTIDRSGVTWQALSLWATKAEDSRDPQRSDTLSKGDSDDVDSAPIKAMGCLLSWQTCNGFMFASSSFKHNATRSERAVSIRKAWRNFLWLARPAPLLAWT